jgi:hypothetical protein
VHRAQQQKLVRQRGVLANHGTAVRTGRDVFERARPLVTGCDPERELGS